MFRRNQVKSQGRLAREELNESYGHLRMAAAHAAGGAAGVLAPRLDAAGKTIAPVMNFRADAARAKAYEGLDSLIETARKSARQGRSKLVKKESRMSRRRWPMIVGGLIAAGAAVGAASALMKRRNRGPEWDEYSATREVNSIMDTAKNAMDAGVDKASPAVDAVKDRSSDLIGSTTGQDANQDTNQGRPEVVRGEFKQQRDDMYGKPASSPTSGTRPGQ